MQKDSGSALCELEVFHVIFKKRVMNHVLGSQRSSPTQSSHSLNPLDVSCPLLCAFWLPLLHWWLREQHAHITVTMARTKQTARTGGHKSMQFKAMKEAQRKAKSNTGHSHDRPIPTSETASQSANRGFAFQHLPPAVQQTMIDIFVFEELSQDLSKICSIHAKIVLILEVIDRSKHALGEGRVMIALGKAKRRLQPGSPSHDHWSPALAACQALIEAVPPRAFVSCALDQSAQRLQSLTPATQICLDLAIKERCQLRETRGRVEYTISSADIEASVRGQSVVAGSDSCKSWDKPRVKGSVCCKYERFFACGEPLDHESAGHLRRLGHELFSGKDDTSTNAGDSECCTLCPA